MKLIVNGQEQEVQAVTLAALLADLELADAVVATARNGEFIRSRERATTQLKEGDTIEIVSPRQGG